jgi:hypothetical protein
MRWWCFLNTLSWFRAKKSLLFLRNDACLSEKQEISIASSLVWSDWGSNPRSTTLEAIQPTIYHTRGDPTHDLPHSRRSNPRSTTLEAIEPTIYHTRGDHAHHNTTDARINIHIVLPHRYKTADTIDMSLYLSWFWAKTVFVLTPEGCVLCTGATHTKCSLGSGLENCHTRGQHANYYTTEALLILNNVR